MIKGRKNDSEAEASDWNDPGFKVLNRELLKAFLFYPSNGNRKVENLCRK